MKNKHIAIAALVWLLSPVATAETNEAEIQYLLESIGQSQCAFIRNGKTHGAAEAESHLRMKYRNGKFWVDDAEQFIERIASKSSWSKKPYYIDCPDTGSEPAGEWLSKKLTALRKKI